MAVAPLNKFITVAVPVAPGIQTVYTTPIGVSAIVLYCSVANVAGVTTFPKVNINLERESTTSKTLGNINLSKIANEIEIPPNDTLLALDGRLVLERTAVYKDSISISGIQSGTVNITGVAYSCTTGVTTITTNSAHNFVVGQRVTMSGIGFTCTNLDGSEYTAGITSTIFPNPQRSFEVLENNVSGDYTKFVTNVGIVNGINHHYVSNTGQVAPLHMDFILSILENSSGS